MGTSESDSQKATEKKALTEVSGGPKKQQNTMLLFNAMRTTAVHSKVTPPSVPAVTENVEMGTPAPFPGFRAPATPATPAPDTTPSVPQKDSGLAEQPKGIPGAGKKKRKSERAHRRFFPGSTHFIFVRNIELTTPTLIPGAILYTGSRRTASVMITIVRHSQGHTCAPRRLGKFRLGPIFMVR